MATVHERIREERIKKIAYSIWDKRTTVWKCTNGAVNLVPPGDDKSDWYKAERYFEYRDISSVMKQSVERLLDDNPYACIPVYHSQAVTASECFNILQTGQRYIHLMAPFQSGKTGVMLCLSEIFLKYHSDMSKIPRVAMVSMPGQTSIQNQLALRTNDFSWTSCINNFAYIVQTHRCNASHDVSRAISDAISYSSKERPLLLIFDESHYGTESGGLFDRLVVQERKKHRKTENVYFVSVSATPYEQLYSDAPFAEVCHVLSPGYIGPDRIGNKEFPKEKGYSPKDVTIQELVTEDYRYWSKKGN